MNNPLKTIYQTMKKNDAFIYDLLRTINPGDLLDRLSIVQLKIARLHNIDFASERDVYKDAAAAILAQTSEEIYEEVISLYEDMKNLNGQIWDLEEDIRMNREAVCKNLEEVGRRTIEIRDINDERVKIRNHINLLLGVHFQEVKSCQKNWI
jgi:hypothetical protein